MCKYKIKFQFNCHEKKVYKFQDFTKIFYLTFIKITLLYTNALYKAAVYKANFINSILIMS